MFIIPAVDIKNGKCVQLVQGKPGTEQIILDNPAKVARKWQDKGASILHVIDLGGALEEGGNLAVVEEILKEVSYPFKGWRHPAMGRCHQITGHRVLNGFIWDIGTEP
jgi:phosphoribosylformimino-5-aminoimidazole carboxamide ribotide isomerase